VQAGGASRGVRCWLSSHRQARCPVVLQPRCKGSAYRIPNWCATLAGKLCNRLPSAGFTHKIQTGALPGQDMALRPELVSTGHPGSCPCHNLDSGWAKNLR
jgi:hypothetical protein